MKKLSETYKEQGIAFTFPIMIKNKNGRETYLEESYGYWHRREYGKKGKVTYYEDSDGFWCRREYDENGNVTYFEDSYGYRSRREYDENSKQTYFENSDGDKQVTEKGSCAGKVIEVDGKKYKLTEL